MLGLAIRIGQRLKIHSESENKKFTVFEAEMRRRLWWAMVILDARVSEKSDHKDLSLAPTWNCKPPMNVNDSDLHTEMKFAPTISPQATELIFTAIRSELNDFIRHSTSFLDFSNPILEFIAAPLRLGSERNDLTGLANTINDKYLRYCNLDNPLHFVTVWTARGILARSSLMEHFSALSKSSNPQTGAHRDEGISHALRVLECDTHILASPLTKRFCWWFLHLQFPLPAYLYIAQDLKRRPFQENAKRSWRVLSDNYEARFENMAEMETRANPFFKMFCRVFLQAWTARIVAAEPSNILEKLPGIITTIKRKLRPDRL